MFTEKTTSLSHFEEANAENLVRELFWLFERSGRWYGSVEEQCRRLQLSDAEREAAWSEQIEAYQAMNEHERSAEGQDRLERALATLGSFKWVLELDEFAIEYGLWMHTSIKRNDVVIHVLHLGYGEAGRSDDPNVYILYRPGDENDYSKVHFIHKAIDYNSALRREVWINQPIQDAYNLHRRSGMMYG